LTRRVSGPNPDLIPPRCLRQHQAYAGCLGPCNGAGRAVLADQQLAPHTREHRTSESPWRLRLPPDRPLCQPHRSLRLVLRCDGVGTTARIATARNRHHDGGLRILPVHRWLGARGADDAFDDVVVAMCSGPKIELGCSPECLVVHLIQRGVPALSFDRSATAIRLAGRCGAPALLGDLFQPSPQAGGAPSPEWAVGKQFCWSTAMSVWAVTRGRSGPARRGSGATSGTGGVAAARRRLRPGSVAGQSDRPPRCAAGVVRRLRRPDA